MDDPRPDSQPGAGPPQGPDTLPPLAARRFKQALWWWRGAGLGFLVLGGIMILFDIGFNIGPDSLAAAVIGWVALVAGLGGVIFTQIRCVRTFWHSGLISDWLAGVWIGVIALALMWPLSSIPEGGQLDEEAVASVSYLALFFLSIGVGLLVLAVVDASVAARTGTPLLRLRHRPPVMGLLLFVLWILEIYGVIGFDRANNYSFIIVLLAPWLLHMREPTEDPEPGVTPRSAEA